MVEHTQSSNGRERLWPYLLIGIFFGIVATKSELISWFRIQEMFRFQAFHMYGVIGSAVAVSVVSVRVIKMWNLRAADGSAISIAPKTLGGGTRYWAGGTLFGLGWALTGGCPGPLFILVGNGYTVMLVALAAAVAGAWTYGFFRPRLIH
ncbi:MAG TPA: YeeE/YedE thiosulfate transporter family protein [Vicinamibacterales bacterium]|jgi:uncharacterized membrane protein YedE/YeeE|nr:YeeE/YedE thiosulfate transporter family protein [Vicinamibacterales bacterium]